jgi:hypothetical protein
MQGKCPKCEKDIVDVTTADVMLKGKNGGSVKGITFNCGHCAAVLSVTLDPTVIKSMVGEAIKHFKEG